MRVFKVKKGMLCGWRSEFQVRAMELVAIGLWVVTLCLWGPGEVDRMSS